MILSGWGDGASGGVGDRIPIAIPAAWVFLIPDTRAPRLVIQFSEYGLLGWGVRFRVS